MADDQRPLNERGRKQGQALAEYFARFDLDIDVILCSAATRTRQTLDLVLPALGAAKIEILPSLYGGSPDTYLDEVNAADRNHVMLIGHNPTCDELVHMLAARGGDAAERLAATHYATGSWTTLVFEGAYAEGKGKVEHFMQPRELLAKSR
jgi:phosphohistidine phosphatase